MGLIDDVLDDAAESSEDESDSSDTENDSESEDTADENGSSTPAETFTTAEGVDDVFLTHFDTEHIKLDDETLNRLLSLAVVISNLVN